MNAEPPIYLIHNFLSAIELDHLTNLALSSGVKKHASFTETSDGTRQFDAEERTSTFASLAKAQDNVVRNTENRASDAVGLPVTHVEPMQVFEI